MKKQTKWIFICIILIGVISAGLVGWGHNKVHAGDSGPVAVVAGTATDPYQITDCQDLQNISNNLSADYILTGPIDCSATTTWNNGAGFMPIQYFNGVLNGQGYTITGLYINDASDTFVGIFGWSNSASGAIENLTISDANVNSTSTAASYTGVLVGSYNGTIANIQITNSSVQHVNTNDTCSAVGGLAGSSSNSNGGGDDSVIDSSFEGTIDFNAGNGSGGCNVSVGGLVGQAGNGNFSNDYAQAVTSVGDSVGMYDNIGGLFGEIIGVPIISNSYAAGSITLNGSPLGIEVGGLIGIMNNGGSVSLANNFTTTSLSVPSPWSNSYVGAMLGLNVGGFFEDYSTDYYDQTAVGIDQCDGSGGVGCNAINTSAIPQGSYFDNNSTAPPLNQWDFNGTWQTTSGLPTLQTSIDPNPTAPTNLYGLASTNSVVLNWTAPTSSGESTINYDGDNNSGYYIVYEITGSNDWYYDFTESDATTFTLSNLQANTSYNMEVYAVNQDNFNGAVSTPTTVSTSKAKSYAISTCQQLQDMNNDLTGHYVLSSNIDCSATRTWNNGEGFLPIGGVNGNGPISFTGTLNGNGHIISGIFENGMDDSNLETISGLFLFLDNATITNLNITDSTFTGGIAADSISGGMIGSTTIANVQVTGGKVTGLGYIESEGEDDSYFGYLAGLVGVDEGGSIEQSSYNGSLIQGAHSTITGGLIGGGISEAYQASISNSYANVAFTSSSNQKVYIGGILGYTGGPGVTIINSYSSGTLSSNVTPASGSAIGGLVGVISNGSGVTHSFSSLTIPPDWRASGIFGQSGVPIDLSTDYFDVGTVGGNVCSGGGYNVSNCKMVDAKNSPDTTYFDNTTTNPPLNAWDFHNIWYVTSKLPVLIPGRTNVEGTPPLKNMNPQPINSLPLWPVVNSTSPPKLPSSKAKASVSGVTTYADIPPKGLHHGSVSAIIKSVKNAVQHFIKNVPAGVIINFPYILCGMLVMAALLVIAEFGRQTKRLRAVQAIIAKQSTIAEERDTFWHLAANYLRAPVTLLVGGAELLSEENKVAMDMSLTISDLATKLQAKVAAIMQRIESSHSLRDIHWPKTSSGTRVIRQFRFWLPVAGVAALGVLTDYVAKDFRHLSTSTISYLTQIMTYVIVVIILYWFLSRLSMTDNKRRWAEIFLKGQQASLNRARKNLINTTAKDLDADVDRMRSEISNVPKEDSALLMLKEGSRRLRQIIDGFQLLINVENGTLTALAENGGAMTMLDKVINENINDLQSLADTKNIQIVIPSRTNVALPGNRSIVSQVVSSILANAIDFSPTGGKVMVELKSQPGNTLLMISDQGQGMTKDQLAHLFQPFARADGLDALQLDHGGLGINLYLDKQIMDLLGGSISVDTTPGKGSTFTVKWPVRQESPVGVIMPFNSAYQGLAGAGI